MTAAPNRRVIPADTQSATPPTTPREIQREIPREIPRVLSIAGTDPTGGAGIQADLKSIMAAGGYGMCVITALVAQNTHGVRSVHTPPLEFLDEQLKAVFDDVTVDAIKIGMLGNAAITRLVSDWLTRVSVPRIVLDPVMVATSGDRLLDASAEQAMRELAKQATIITPNIPELGVLVDAPPATTLESALEQGRELARSTQAHVVVKGGHLTGDDAGNTLVTPAGNTHHVFAQRLDSTNTHGTGCSLSSALATKLSQTGDAQQSLEWATSWLHDAIAAADVLEVGTGNGPVHHGVRLGSV